MGWFYFAAVVDDFAGRVYEGLFLVSACCISLISKKALKNYTKSQPPKRRRTIIKRKRASGP